MSEKPPAYEPPQAGYPAPPAYPPADAYGPPPGQPSGYPPAQAGYPAQGPPGTYQPPPPPTGTATVIVAQPTMNPYPGATMRYGQGPAVIVCQHCQATVTTSLEYESGLLTWAAVGVICLFMCWLGCCLIPFCIDALKDVQHRCPNCKNIVGRFRHFS